MNRTKKQIANLKRDLLHDLTGQLDEIINLEKSNLGVIIDGGKVFVEAYDLHINTKLLKAVISDAIDNWKE